MNRKQREPNDLPERRDMLVRMPWELHGRLRETAQRHRLSANQIVVTALEQICRRSEAGRGLDDNTGVI